MLPWLLNIDWQSETAESTLNSTYSDLIEELSFFVGWGRDTSSLSASQTAQLDSMFKSGLRRLLFPPPVGGRIHPWSFLKMTDTFSTADGEGDYDLNGCIGSISGDITVDDGSGAVSTVTIVSEGQIRQWRMATEDTEGTPAYCAIRPRYGSDPPRMEIMFHPIPDGTYTVEYRFNVLPDMMGASELQWLIGGTPHVETLLEACLSVAEERMNDVIGLHKQSFAERLAASVAYDMQQTPDKFGSNTNPGSIGWTSNDRVSGYITYNGTYSS